MPDYWVHLKRTDTYSTRFRYTANSEEELRLEVAAAIDEEGWAAFTDDDDGEYEECWTEIDRVEPATEEESAHE